MTHSTRNEHVRLPHAPLTHLHTPLRRRSPRPCARPFMCTSAGATGETHRRSIDGSVASEEVVASASGQLAGPSRRMPAGGDKRAHTWARLDAFGIADLAQRPHAEWRVEPSSNELRLAQSLESAVESRVRSATDPGTLATAETYLERFTLALPSRLLFRKRGGADDADARAHNNQTFELLREFIRVHGSLMPGQRGRTLPADTISRYVGALSEALSATLRGPLASLEGVRRKRRVQKSWLLEDGPRAADRETTRLAFRGRHFKLSAASAFDRLTPHGQYRWTVALVTWQCLMRPGEPGRGSGRTPWNAKRGLKLADVTWWSQLQTEDGRPAVVLSILPVKDKDGRSQRCPCPISALSASPMPGGEACCTYSQFWQYWLARRDAVCQQTPRCSSRTGRFCERCSTEPLFASPATGHTWRTPDGIAVVRDMCAAIGQDPNLYVGYSLRIGGASDLEEGLGATRAEAVSRQRGRWRSDIGNIYRRNTPREQLDASVAMLHATGNTMETLMPGWVQPTRGWYGRG